MPPAFRVKMLGLRLFIAQPVPEVTSQNYNAIVKTQNGAKKYDGMNWSANISMQMKFKNRRKECGKIKKSVERTKAPS